MYDRQSLVEELKKLKQVYGMVAVKAEFEAEGSRKDELIMLREMIYQADLDFVIKIGGCEAVHDLDQCKLLDATGIMAPMIETSFAMSKFKQAAKRVYLDNISKVSWIINAETQTCRDNFDSILSEGEGFLSGVTVGRSDLSASMGISKTEMENDKVFYATKEFLEKAKDKKLVSNFGGNIGIQSIDFIKKISNITDRFETRKVVLAIEDDSNKLKKMIKEALEFELQYLKFKANYYSTMAVEDGARISRLEKQINMMQ